MFFSVPVEVNQRLTTPQYPQPLHPLQLVVLFACALSPQQRLAEKEKLQRESDGGQLYKQCGIMITNHDHTPLLSTHRVQELAKGQRLTARLSREFVGLSRSRAFHRCLAAADPHFCTRLKKRFLQ